MSYLNQKYELTYYWYHHMMDDTLRKDIQTAIDNHDFNAFMLYYNDLNRDYICYLPSTASMYRGDEHICDLSILCEATFSMITYSECECG